MTTPNDPFGSAKTDPELMGRVAAIENLVVRMFGATLANLTPTEARHVTKLYLGDVATRVHEFSDPRVHIARSVAFERIQDDTLAVAATLRTQRTNSASPGNNLS